MAENDDFLANAAVATQDEIEKLYILTKNKEVKVLPTADVAKVLGGLIGLDSSAVNYFNDCNECKKTGSYSSRSGGPTNAPISGWGSLSVINTGRVIYQIYQQLYDTKNTYIRICVSDSWFDWKKL